MLQEAGALPRDPDPRATFFALLLPTVGPLRRPQTGALVLEGEEAPREDFPAGLAEALTRGAGSSGE